MDVLLVVVPAVAVFGAGYLLVRLGMRRWPWRHTVPPIPERVVPQWWDGYLQRCSPLYRQLPPDQRNHLLQLTALFLDEKSFEGCGGLTLTEEMRLVIAAQACLLLLGVGAHMYPSLRTVLVYPGTFVPRYVQDLAHGEPAPEEGPLLGESWDRGVVILSWDSVLEGLGELDGNNVVLHELAHQLDQEDGVSDGFPEIDLATPVDRWRGAMARAFNRLRESDGSILDSYGATDEAEFFSVATEAFFEVPRELVEEDPELFNALREYYRIDPRTWSPTRLGPARGSK